MKLTEPQIKLARRIQNNLFFTLYLFKSLPMGWLAGLRIRELSGEKCVTSVPFKWITKNPFKSIYFAVQSMAAELSTASGCLLAVHGHRPSVAFIIVDMKASFFKKATGRVYFTCEDGSKAFAAVEKCINSGEPASVTLKTTGKMQDGTVVSEFDFTWSFKQRTS